MTDVMGRWMEELDLTVRSYWVVKKLGVTTVADLLGGTSAVDVVAWNGSDIRCRYDIEQRLRQAGVDAELVDGWLGGPARHPIPAYPEGGGRWGMVFVDAGLDAATAAVRRAYLDAGLVEDPTGELEPDGVGAERSFGPDALALYHTGERFTVVLSRRFETAAPGGNPLAAALSASLGWTAYAFRQDGPVGELVAYEAGRAVPFDVAGLPLTDAERQSLPGLRQNLPALLRLLGVRSYGWAGKRYDHLEGEPFLTFRASDQPVS